MSDSYTVAYLILTDFIPRYFIPIILSFWLVGFATRFMKNPK